MMYDVRQNHQMLLLVMMPLNLLEETSTLWKEEIWNLLESLLILQPLTVFKFLSKDTSMIQYHRSRYL